MSSAPASGSSGERIARNVGALAVARGVTMALTLVTTGVVARAVGPAGLGTLGFGLALVGYFSIAGSLGLEVLGQREAARDRSGLRALAGDVVSLRLALSAAALVAYAVAVWLVPRGPAFKAVLAVQGLVLLGQAVSLEWVYQGVERMGTIAVRNVAASLFTLVATLLLVHGPGDIVWAAAAQTGAVLVVGAGLLVSFRRDFGPLPLRVDLARWRAMAREAAPFAASVLMIAVYYQLDKIMLGVLRTDTETGLYEAAYRVAALALVPVQVLAQAFFSQLAAAFGDAARMRTIAGAYARVNLGVGLPLAAGTGLLAAPLVALIAGPEYAAAAGPLRVLAANVAATCLTMSFGQPLLAWDRQRLYLAVVGSGAVVNVLLNVVLIPRHGPLGASVATLCAELAVLAAGAVAHRRMTGRLYGGAVARAVTATVVGVGGGVLGMQALGAPWPLQAVGGAVGYALAAPALGAVRVAELRALRRR